MRTPLTVNQLIKELQAAKNKGLGEKKIMISDDDEGNGYHDLFFGITNNVADVVGGEYGPELPYGVDKKKAADEYVILG